MIINWNALVLSLKSQDVSDRSRNLKLIIGWENNGKQKQRIDDSSNLFPVCTTEIGKTKTLIPIPETNSNHSVGILQKKLKKNKYNTTNNRNIQRNPTKPTNSPQQ